jgi:hypothetical protein
MRVVLRSINSTQRQNIQRKHKEILSSWLEISLGLFIIYFLNKKSLNKILKKFS